MRAPVHLWGEHAVFEELARIYQHIFAPHRNPNKSFVAEVVCNRVVPAEPFDLFGVRVTPLRLLHGRLPVLGFRFDVAAPASGAPGPLPLAYCTDVNAIPPETWPLLRGLDTLVLDMLRERAHPTHFTLAESLDAAARIAARRTVFTHMTHDIRHAEHAARLPAGVELGFDGMRLGPGPEPA
jgi:phosphoribosyl 1,2-cyclic phosphate phosphodiesterase